MKFMIILAVCAVAAAEYYDAKYDSFNVDELISNDRLMNSFTSCFLDTGKCTNDASELKTWIPEAIENSCAKCTEKQKPLVAKYLATVREKMSEQYKALSKKYVKPNDVPKVEDFISKYH